MMMIQSLAVAGGREVVGDVKIETPSSSRRVLNRFTMAIRSDASTIDTGSSATMSAGRG